MGTFVVTWPIFTVRQYASMVLAIVMFLSVCLTVPGPTGGAYNASAIFHSEVKESYG